MSTLLEIKSEEEWKEHSVSLPPTTLQIIYFKAEWAQPVSVLHIFFWPGYLAPTHTAIHSQCCKKEY